MRSKVDARFEARRLSYRGSYNSGRSGSYGDGAVGDNIHCGGQVLVTGAGCGDDGNVGGVDHIAGASQRGVLKLGVRSEGGGFPGVLGFLHTGVDGMVGEEHGGEEEDCHKAEFQGVGRGTTDP